MRKLLIIFLFLISSTIYADPPARVARLSYLQGPTSFSSGTSKLWVKAKVNRPLVAGDQLWVDSNARAEIQLGGAMVRIEDGTSLRLLNFNDRAAQFHLAQGTLILRVRYMTPDQTYEIDTPNLAFVVRKSGNYRIDVDPDTNSTTVRVRSGRATVYSKNKVFPIKAPQSLRFVGPHFVNYQVLKTDVLDAFDRWSLQRDNYASKSKSARYVSSTMVGYEDLDNYGSWRYIRDYGNVWVPRRVSRGWAPYRNGHWSWIEPWGWTWIDEEPWGFAPSHYGRWAYYRDSWVWIPGPRTVVAHYAPALVVFVSRADAGVAWIPLGPRDVYIPPYAVSESYFTSINISNTTINNTQINNVYNNTTIQNNYINATAPNAVTAVPVTTFTEAQSVAPAAMPISQASVTTTTVTPAAPVAPTSASTMGAATTNTKPPEAVIDSNPAVVVTPPAPSASAETNTPPPTVIKPEEPTTTTTDTPKAPAEDQPSSVVPTPVAPSDSTSTSVQPTPPAPTEPATPTPPPESAVAPTSPVDNSGADKAAAEAERAAADKAIADQRAAAEKAAQEKAEADKAAAEQQAAAEKAAQEKAEADKAAAEQQAAAEKASQEKAEAEKAASEQAASEIATREQAEAEKAAAQQQAAAEKASQEKAEAEKAAAEEQAAAEKAAQEKAEADKANAEQAGIADTNVTPAAPPQ